MTEKSILITGAAGFIGKNLSTELRNRGYKNILLFDIQNSEEELESYCKKADFVFHLAGINRPKVVDEFYSGNTAFTEKLLSTLSNVGSKAPILVTSSIQAELDNDYGKSKALAENAIYDFGSKNNVPVFVFRLVGVFGKWCRPNYNSVVATFCYNIANELPIEISNPDAVVKLCYIDDVINTLIMTLENSVPLSTNKPLQVEPSYQVTLKELSELINSYKTSRESVMVPSIKNGFSAKLYGTYTSYLPSNEFSYRLKNNVDNRGHLAEFLKDNGFGQLFVSTTKPGITRGNHWHHTKTEKFFVVYGEALIRIRKIDESEICEILVSGENPMVVDIPTGYTHNITNVGDGDLVTLFWSSEVFNPQKTDTYFMEV